MNDDQEKYRGQPYVRMVRVSDAGEKQNSDAAQLKYLKDWADERLMVHATDFVENDLTGSLPGNRTDFQAVFHRADTLKDFKYVLSMRVDRTTRGGADHLFWFEHELKRRGIKLVFPGDALPENVPFRNTLLAAKADAAQETATSTAQRSAQGSQYALEGGRVSPHSRTPFGCYRLYCRADGTVLHVIVDKRNGLQEKRSWPQLDLIDTYGTLGGGKVGHYKKQKSELVFLVLGDPREREIVILIFKLRYEQGYSARKIAQHLNGEGIPAPMGGPWAEGQVSNIYNNEDYTARGIANRKSAARYFRRHRNGPQKVEHDDQTLTTASSLKPIIRPEDDWHEGGEPYMLDFLGDENLRQTAMAKQKGAWARRLDPTYNPKNKKKYTAGPYLLYPLLRCKQKNESLVGSLAGRDGTYPVYRHNEAKRNPKAGSIYNRVFNATALEAAVLNVLSEILLDWPDLQPRLLAHVQQQVASAGGNDTALAQKRNEVGEVREQLLLYVRTLTPKTQADLAPEIRRLESRRDVLDAEIEMLLKQQTAVNVDPHAVVAGLQHRLATLAKDIPNLPPMALADVLAQVTDHLRADMETKIVDFSFHFPTWMLAADATTSLAAMCTRTNLEFQVGQDTQRDPRLTLPLSHGKCGFTKHKHSVTCHCRREWSAA